MSDRRILREWLPLEKKEGGQFLVEDTRRCMAVRLLPEGTDAALRGSEPEQADLSLVRCLQREFENYFKAVKESRAMGELDHPETSTVSLEKVSHIVREMWWDGNTWMGKVEVLNTPCGKILESLADSGVTLGISSRGVGSTNTNNEGLDLVADDFTLVCFDMVAEPSTHGAYMFAESVDKNRGAVLNRADRIARVLRALKGDQ
jgi:hypothetical protein